MQEGNRRGYCDPPLVSPQVRIRTEDRHPELRVSQRQATSRAAQKLAEAGMQTSTLQNHLARGEQIFTGEKRLYILDEPSLASTRQLHDFLNRLHPNDRVLFLGELLPKRQIFQQQVLARAKASGQAK